MSRAFFRLAIVSAAFGLMVATSAAAQDFQKSYRLNSGSSIRIGNISGDVRVTGYDGDAVVVTGTKHGRDLDMVEIEDRSTGNRVDVRVRYPENCRRCDVSVEFEVKVPRSVSYDFDGIASVSGSVEIDGVSGEVSASSVSGEVRIKNVAGSVSASSVSGNVDVEISRLEGNGNMKFSSVSGNVDVRLPASLDADVSMSSLSGSLKSDFAIEMQKERYGPGRSGRGRVGSGSRSLRMSSVSGSLSLRQL
jgi:hypothetical protein